MNLSTSQCGTSGCESGWTFYLDQSSYSQTQCQQFDGNFNEHYVGKGGRFLIEDEEEGLSMVSDASSGPRHYYSQDYVECLDENVSFCSHPARATPQPAKMKEHCSNQHHHSPLDDTASSPVISFSENLKEETSIELLDFSQGFSGTHFKKKLGFLKSGKTSSKHAGKKQGMTKG